MMSVKKLFSHFKESSVTNQQKQDPSPTVPDSKEAEKLRLENESLREEIQRLADQLRASYPGAGVEIYRVTEGDKDLYQHLQQTLSDTSVTTLRVETEPIRPPTASPHLAKVPSHDTEFLESQSKKAVIVCAPGKDEDDEDEVCVMDLTKAEWWTIVDSERDRKTLRDESETRVPCELTSGDEEDDSYVMVDDRDLGDALSNFVALSMKHYPEAKTLSPKQLNKLMEQTFGGLKPPSTVGKLYGWAHLAYNTYGWACCLWSLYKEPVMVKIAAAGALRACSWVLILLW